MANLPLRHANQRCTVAVLDGASPPGLAFIRSLGSRGVSLTICSDSPRVAARYSRYAGGFLASPPIGKTDELIGWLADRLRAGEIGVIAPTSDQIVFATAAAYREAGLEPSPSSIDLANAWRVLHKGSFGEACREAGVPTLDYSLPTSRDEALAAAEELGYPLVLKPRSHIGVGLHRGLVVAGPAALSNHFAPFDIERESQHAVDLDPDLAWPILQRYVEPERCEVISVSGCISDDGELLVVDACHKLRQWPPLVGIGSLFEAIDDHPLIEVGVDLVRSVLDRGLFEIEFVLDSETGDYWPIDLNPRGYGQMELAIARGNDLPGRWYELETGIRLRPLPTPGRVPEVWQSRLTLYPGVVADKIRHPRGGSKGMAKTLRRPSVDAMFRLDDPLPALVLGAIMLRYPGNFIRPFMKGSRPKLDP